MKNQVTNADLQTILLDIKGDIGSLQATSALQLEGLRDHSVRIRTLEDTSSRQKGAMTAWGLVATAVAALAGGVADYFRR